MTNVDRMYLRRLYGRTRGIDVLPLCVADSFRAHPTVLDQRWRTGYLLFVGGSFYANIDGITSFKRQVAPHIDCPKIVVGRGIELVSSNVEGVPKVQLVGEADDLNPWYANCSAALTPTFAGSGMKTCGLRNENMRTPGMKTKVAEALIHGKPIVGTAQAFASYELVANKARSVCNGAREFIEWSTEIFPCHLVQV